MPAAPRHHLRLRRTLADPGVWAVAGAVAVAMAAVWADPTHRLVGHTLGEGTSHLWVQWLIDRWLVDGHPPFGQQGVVAHERLWFVPTDLSTRAGAHLLGRWVGPVAAYNVTVAFLLALAGGSTVALARQAGATRGASALAGVWMVWAPSLLGFAADGRVDSLGVGWVGLWVWTLLRVVRQPSLARGVVLGGATIGVMASGPNPSLALALVGGGPVLWWMGRRAAVRRPFLVAGAVLAPVALVVGWTIVDVESHDPGRLERSDPPASTAPIAPYDPDLDGAVHHVRLWQAAHAVDRDAWVQPWHRLPASLQAHPAMAEAASHGQAQVVAPGARWTWTLVPWSLAIWGLLRRRPGAGQWVVLAGVCQVLALGLGPAQALPLRVLGEDWVVAPCGVLHHIPGLRVFNNFGLYGPMASMAVAVAAACGWREHPGWLGLLALAWGVEVQSGPVPLPLRATDLTVPAEVLSTLDGVDPRRSIVSLPRTTHADRWLQSLHHHPSVQRFRLGKSQAADGRDGVLAAGSRSVAALEGRALGGASPRTDRTAGLAADGVGAVVLLPELLPADARPAYRAAVTEALGPPDVQADGVWVFLVPSRPGPVWWADEVRGRHSPPSGG